MDDFAAMRAQGPFRDSAIPDPLGLLDTGVPLVGGIERYPVTFSSTSPVGR